MTMSEQFSVPFHFDVWVKGTFMVAHTEGRLILSLLTHHGREYRLAFDYGRLRYIRMTTPDMREQRISRLLLERDFFGEWRWEGGKEPVPFRADFPSFPSSEISIATLTDFAYMLINRAHKRLLELGVPCGKTMQLLISRALGYDFQELEAERMSAQALNVDLPLILPPFVDQRLCFPLTQGCRKQSLYGPCSFCDTFIARPFRIFSLEEIFDQARKRIAWLDGRVRSGYEIFLTEGDALVAPTRSIEALIRFLGRVFPDIPRISTFASVLSLQGHGEKVKGKSPAELRRLKQIGLTRIYLGVESGSDVVLRDMNKGTNQKSLLTAADKIREAGLELACMIVSGYGGSELYQEHLRGTIEFLNQSRPDRVFFSRMAPKHGTAYWSRKDTVQDRSKIEEWENEVQRKVSGNIIFRQYTQLNLS